MSILKKAICSYFFQIYSIFAVLKCFPAVSWLFSRVLKPKSPLVSLVTFTLLDPGKQPTHSWKTFSHGKISKSVEKNKNKVLFFSFWIYICDLAENLVNSCGILQQILFWNITFIWDLHTPNFLYFFKNNSFTFLIDFD